MNRAPINPTTSLVIDFSVDIEDVASAAGISARAVQNAIRKTVKHRNYKWHGRRLHFRRALTRDFKLSNEYFIVISNLSDEIQRVLIEILRTSIAANMASYRS